jgi:hypothetical protein
MMPKVAGITVERTYKGIPRYVRIDLHKHRDLIPLLEAKGIHIEPDVKFTAKMKRSIQEAKNGEVTRISLEELLDV